VALIGRQISDWQTDKEEPGGLATLITQQAFVVAPVLDKKYLAILP
jgi:hypothetical protein